VRKAKAMPSALAGNFLTKRLNQWVNADTTWMPMDDWKRCGDAKLQLADFAGEPLLDRLDLAEKRDFAAKVPGVPPDGRGSTFVRLYLNELAVLESGNAHLRAGRAPATSP
jgi:hypothetical protein